MNILHPKISQTIQLATSCHLSNNTNVITIRKKVQGHAAQYVKGVCHMFCIINIVFG